MVQLEVLHCSKSALSYCRFTDEEDYINLSEEKMENLGWDSIDGTLIDQHLSGDTSSQTLAPG